MPKVWDTFEWDDENKKNGNVQHLREHDIEPEEAEECFFHGYTYCQDERMLRAKRQSPGAIRLPSKLVENLKTLAESEGEPEYQTMVKRWIEERLQQETSTAR